MITSFEDKKESVCKIAGTKPKLAPNKSADCLVPSKFLIIKNQLFAVVPVGSEVIADVASLK